MSWKLDKDTGSSWVRLRHVSRRFGGHVVLRRVTVEMRGGTVHVVRGANGSGKTTLLRVMAGELATSTGTVVVGGYAREWGAGVGFVARRPRLYPDLTAMENVRLSARLHGVNEAEGAVERVVEDLGGGTFWDRPVRTLSTGQVQRGSLACALVFGPRVLLLDEPMSGLDQDGIRRLTDRVRALVSRGGLVVLVTHRRLDLGPQDSHCWRLRRGLLLRE